MITLGIDPDTQQSGIAIYYDGALIDLRMMSLLQLHDFITDQKPKHPIRGCIENLLANGFLYNRHAMNKGGPAVQVKIALDVGRNQQAQYEIMRLFEYHYLPYQLIKPTANNWANNEALFKKATGWPGRSNPDTRSAAYFGYLMQAAKLCQ